MSQQELMDKEYQIFVEHGECKHNPDFFTEVAIPNSISHFTTCGICHKNIKKWYGVKPMKDGIMDYLTGTKTRAQIYFRFRLHKTCTFRGRLSELKKLNLIFSIEENTFTPVEKEIMLSSWLQNELPSAWMKQF